MNVFVVERRCVLQRLLANNALLILDTLVGIMIQNAKSILDWAKHGYQREERGEDIGKLPKYFTVM